MTNDLSPINLQERLEIFKQKDQKMGILRMPIFISPILLRNQ
jgi:hypothetical protein